MARNILVSLTVLHFKQQALLHLSDPVLDSKGFYIQLNGT